MRVAFTMIGGKNWTGGYNYLLNLVRAVGRYEPDSLVPVMFFGEDTEPSDATPFFDIPGTEVVRTSVFDEARKSRALVHSLLLGRDDAVQTEFRKHRIDAVFEAAQFHGWRSGPPAVAWIPDFQHRLLPQLFGHTGFWKRELGFRAQVASGRTIMLSSDDSRRACERLYPSTVGRTSTVRFAIPARAPLGASQARAVATRYGLPTRYFFLPNQFWQHKNHALVIDALTWLHQRGHTDIVVAASGNTNDPRNPAHFAELKARIASRDLALQFMVLGLIPYDDVAPLMLASEALLNPSLFEGWSTTVEEARTLGVPMILSDLEVHREQAGTTARFFDRFSAESLAQALLIPIQSLPVNPDELGRAAEQRMAEFAAAFVAVVRSTVRASAGYR
jgi:Glycosyl transferases group 1